MDLLERAVQIKCLVSDFDGTLTDGGILIENKRIESRNIHIKDVLGVNFWKHSGFQFGIITASDTNATEYCAKIMGTDYLYLNCKDKKKAFMDILDRGTLFPSEVAYIGDDLIDISTLKAAGLAVGVGDGAPELDEFIHYKTKATGGKGAVREVVELILKSKGIWNKIVQSNINR